MDIQSRDYAAGGRLYYRVEAHPGHTYTIYNTSWVPSDMARYYLDANGLAHAYTLSEPFPENTYDNYIYFVYEPQLNGTGSFRVAISSHPVEHGNCEYGYLGTDLEVNVNADTFSMNDGDYKYFRFELSDLGDNWFGILHGSMWRK